MNKIFNSWLLAIGYWLLAIGYWLLAIGYWLLAIGYWLLAIGYWLLAIGYSTRYFSGSILFKVSIPIILLNKENLKIKMN